MIVDAKEFCTTLKTEVFFEDDWNDFLKGDQNISDEILQNYEEAVQFVHPVNIQYTSDTTGFPKGVTLSHHNI